MGFCIAIVPGFALAMLWQCYCFCMTIARNNQVIAAVIPLQCTGKCIAISAGNTYKLSAIDLQVLAKLSRKHRAIALQMHCKLLSI